MAIEAPTSPAELRASLEDRIDDLQHEFYDALDQQWQGVIKPRLESLEADRDDLCEQQGEHQDAIAELRERVRDLESQVDSLIGLAENESGGPEKRAADLQLALVQQVEGTDSTVAMHYRDVQQFFARTGHGEVAKKQCYQAMRTVADRPGFEYREAELTLSGRDVAAIVATPRALDSDAHALGAGSNTEQAAGGGSEAPATVTEVSKTGR